jgi:hypothetical protein
LRRIGIILCAALAAITASAAATPSEVQAATFAEVYAAPNGSGTACTSSAPCSLTGARDKARTLTAGMTGDIEVILSGGTYSLTGTFSLTASAGDGGTSTHKVIYRAATNATPVLSGGVQITGWSQVGSTNVWSAALPADFESRQLYVNGVRAERARGTIASSIAGYSPTGVNLNTNVISTWARPQDAEFVFDRGWQSLRCGVATASGNSATMDQPCWDNITKRYVGLAPGVTFGFRADTYIENARELLDTPGEFYQNTATDTIYYIPRSGETMNTATTIAPAVQTLLTVAGTASQALRNVTFRGITFAHSTWMAPSSNEGFADAQATVHVTGQNGWKYQGTCTRFNPTDPGTCPYGAWSMTPGAVELTRTNGVRFEAAKFAHLGAAGINFGVGTSNSVIESSEVTDVAGSGIQIGNVSDFNPADPSVTPQDNRMSDNWIHGVGRDYAAGVGIFQGYASGSVIEHNQLNHLPYSGISLGWGWGRVASDVEGNKIRNNLIFGAMSRLSDGGAIYTLGSQGSSLNNGVQISGNVINVDSADPNGGSKSIYLDGGTRWASVIRNVTVGAKTEVGGCDENDGTAYGDFFIRDNYFASLATGWDCGAPDNLDWAGNTQISKLQDAPSMIVNRAGVRTDADTQGENLALTRPAQALYVDGTTAQLQPGNTTAGANDGDFDTFTQAFGQYRWQYMVDLGSVRTIGRVAILEPGDKFATAWHVEGSTNGSNYSTIASQTGLTGGGHHEVTMTPTAARYLKVVADAPNAGGQVGGQMALSEVGVYEATNLATGKSSQALFLDGSNAQLQPGRSTAHGNDGDPTTWVQATNQYRWQYVLDLGSAQAVSRVSLVQPPDKFATAWHLEGSTTGSNYTTLATVTNQNVGGYSTITFASQSVRYLKFVVDAPNDGYQIGGQMAISEVGVYAN